MAVGPGWVVAISFGIVILLSIVFIAWKHYTKRTRIPPTDSLAAATRIDAKAEIAKKMEAEAQDSLRPRPIVDSTARVERAIKAA